MEQRKLTYVEPIDYFPTEIREKYFEADDNRIRDFIGRYAWTFAKTYADFAPHEYYVKDKLDEKGQEDFVWFVEYIRENGFDCKFASKKHTYYELDGHYYWTMGDPIDETIILNRCKVDDYEISDGNMYYLKPQKFFQRQIEMLIVPQDDIPECLRPDVDVFFKVNQIEDKNYIKAFAEKYIDSGVRNFHFFGAKAQLWENTFDEVDVARNTDGEYEDGIAMTYSYLNIEDFNDALDLCEEGAILVFYDTEAEER